MFISLLKNPIKVEDQFGKLKAGKGCANNEIESLFIITANHAKQSIHHGMADGYGKKII